MNRLAIAPLACGQEDTQPMNTLDPSEYRTEDSVAYMMHRVHLLLGDAVDTKLAASGLSAMQWGILKALFDGRAQTPTALCRILLSDSGAMTRQLDYLEKRGLIVRIRSTSDRRSVELTLTSGGRSLLCETLPFIVDAGNRQLHGFAVDEIEVLKKFIDRMIVNLSR